MPAERIAGTAFVKVDGKQYELAGSLTVSPSAVEREGKAGLSGVAGYSEKPRVPFIEGEFFTTSGLSTAELESFKDVTVTAELANGKNYVLSNAWCKSALELNAAEGTVQVRFEGLKCQEA